MKFLKINAKVLLILCLFSGILFLSTGCDDNKTKEEAEQKEGTSSKENNGSSTKEGTNEEGTKSTDGNGTSTDKSTGDKVVTDGTAIKDKTDYSVWVANTTINTDKNQKSYRVIWGDTLWLISTAWEVPYQEIARFNNIPNPDLIYVDQVIYNPLFK